MKTFLKGLAAAFLSAAFTALPLGAIAGFKQLKAVGIAAALAGIAGAFAYLKQSPLPK